ncbi:MAG: NUDIX hydrolase [Oscillospiraceae bacterium]
MELIEKKISSKVVFDGRLLHVTSDTVVLPNGNETTREVIWHNGAVCIVAFDEDDNVYMVKQFRYPFNRVILEVPAGKIDQGETPDEAAKRELEEEIGMTATTLVPIGEFYPSVAYTTEIIYMYIATGLKKSSQNLDEDEFLNVEKYNFNTVCNMIMQNEIGDGKTISAILKAKLLK